MTKIQELCAVKDDLAKATLTLLLHLSKVQPFLVSCDFQHPGCSEEYNNVQVDGHCPKFERPPSELFYSQDCSSSVGGVF